MLALKMGGLKVVFLVLGVLMFAIPCSYGVSVACMAVYDEGGAPAVFKSPECHDWVLSAKAGHNETMNCQFESTKGRRRYQEDRISCNLDMKIPLLGENGLEDVRVGVVAVFDGHIGQEASEMASKLVLDYIFAHSMFGSFKNWLSLKEEQNTASQNSNEDVELEPHKATLGSRSFEGISEVILDGSTRMGILKRALVKTIKDIDSSFTEATLENDLAAGSTAVVVLLVDGQILVANVGDSKALLCSEKHPPRQEADGASIPYLSVKELTSDHNPHRDEERARIEAAGGVISGYRSHDMLVINGHFPMTRALGDVPLKRYGIISDPEVTDWQPLTANDSYLVVASDGIFESLKPQKVCNLLRDAHFQDSKQSASCLELSSLANCIVRNAFEKGSTDNLSAVVVPLRSAGFFLAKP
ncbi:hypothetical protein Vadar_025327 [Vaccinium darrowii]|uniref:Uncharacterized protein n=1 Tax=Vaccinium darrowii TaxID=229202 RepID=A0ACB7XCD7_9ERIC|nr:hypothetical protein Vadar_025327 [Vaccinium darrowii]